MIEKQVIIVNNAGLHTRPAAMITKLASRFKSEFYIVKNGVSVNAKSIIGVMTLAAAKGTELTLVFEGEDEIDAAETLTDYFNRGFDEP
ncbi:MAG TPA: HPr family phosphocarrier protein [Melioribacteraceae bacterium]|nr:HPr family phosphocarrier protein [Melioribacteraceae bacterium]